ncbi:MAG: hypothetical protein LBQ93_07395 [Treponema sp.]|nr:hypothetical protein [Treponema sp.]
MSIRGKSIGTRNESSLHRTLKFQYTGPGGKTEVEAGEFVADGIRKNGEYIEVQTGSFAPLKKKVKEFASYGKVRIIHPVAVKKIIEVYKPVLGKKAKKQAGVENGELLYRRKSPVKGSLWNIFDALMYAPELPLIRGVSIEIVLIDITEIRVKDGKGSWRRKGISIKDRQLTYWHESVLFEKPADYLRFIPFKKKEEFTTSILAERAGVDKWTAQKALYVLTKLKIVKRTGKKSNSWVYVRKK